jgi:hypothetical protein
MQFMYKTTGIILNQIFEIIDRNKRQKKKPIDINPFIKILSSKK